MNYATTTDFAPIRLTMDADSGDVVIEHYDYDLDLWYHFETLETDGIDSCYATHEESVSYTHLTLPTKRIV